MAGFAPPNAQTGTATTGNPLQPAYLGAPPQITPTTSGADTSPASALSQLQSANALTNAQHQNSLANLLASEGISGNDATAAQGALAGQLNASQAPALASLITNAQNMGLNQSEFNAGAGNQANALNLSSVMGTNSQNVNAANTAGRDLATLLMQNYGLDLNSVLGILSGGQAGGNAINSQGVAGQLGLNSTTMNQQNQNTNNGWNNLALLAAGFA